ncbi:conserved hypothetical protein [Theileria orientalis strain Shintoku]|uniref:Uncharacterized protein n=1 Tax=Theileria orientalis strain Shintoku TaxID=869250 RepID=J4C7N9_THEOR|nr:conserved hypothetical protein [Theileria orientalis strain Shintoku]BAM39368.1 conserved hypothetical protein [Theileria orientalis strain Shintoku]|eukprot:XP_009689669.1 conserved hypothetical protein [Theileria orientalis strain Shintoku]
MSHYNSSRHPSQSQVSDLSKIGTEDTFMVDLESKVDSLKNISTNINKELLKSKAHLSSLSKTFDSASLSLKGTLSNMSRIAKGYVVIFSSYNIICCVNMAINYVYVNSMFPKYICRSIPVQNKYIYDKFCYVTTFYSYDKCVSRERMKKPFDRAEKQKYDNISHYANKLARNLDFNPVKWEMILSKSKEVYKDFKPIDIALLLNSLSRARFYDSELFNCLIPQIIKNVAFFTSVHISMVLSAYSKGKLLSPELYGVLKSEVKGRMYEFTTSVEMCMIINAISKYGDSDKEFLDSICKHLVKMYHNFNFTSQELSVLINSFVTLGYYNEQLFNLMSKNVVDRLNLCNIYELIRILNGYIIFENNSNRVQSHCKNEMMNKIKYSGQKELTTTLHILGSINYTLVQTNIENRNIVDEMVEAVKRRCLNIIDGFTMSSISHLLISLSKWSLKLEYEELLKAVKQLGEPKMDANLVEMNNTLVAITKLYCSISNVNDFNEIKNEENNELLAEIRDLMKNWSCVIVELLEEDTHDLNVLIKVLDSYSKFNVYEEDLFNRIKNMIVMKHMSELNRNNGYTLNEIFSKKGKCETNKCRITMKY